MSESWHPRKTEKDVAVARAGVAKYDRGWKYGGSSYVQEHDHSEPGKGGEVLNPENVFTRSRGEQIIVWNDGTNIYADGPTGLVDSGAYGVDDATVIQSALDGLTSGRDYYEKVVVVGDYVIDSPPLQVGSWTELEVLGQIKLGAGTDETLIQNNDHTNGNEHIKIKNGVYHGNALNNTEAAPTYTTGQHGFFFRNVSELSITGIEVIDTLKWGVRIQQSDNIDVKSIRFDQRVNSNNQDGVKFIDCHTFDVTRIRGYTGDDMVSVETETEDVYEYSVSDLVGSVNVGAMFAFVGNDFKTSTTEIRGGTISDISADGGAQLLKFDMETGTTLNGATIKNISGANIQAICNINFDNVYDTTIDGFEIHDAREGTDPLLRTTGTNVGGIKLLNGKIIGNINNPPSAINGKFSEIRNITIRDAGQIGIVINSVGTEDRQYISGCKISEMQKNGIANPNNDSWFYIDECEVFNNNKGGYTGIDSCGIALQYGTTTVSDFAVRDCKVYNTTAGGTQEYGIGMESTNPINLRLGIIKGNQFGGATGAVLNPGGFRDTSNVILGNKGLVFNNAGVASVADGDTIAHGLDYTPDWAVVTASGAGHTANVTAKDGTYITIELLNVSDGTSVTTAEDVYWRAGTSNLTDES